MRAAGLRSFQAQACLNKSCGLLARAAIRHQANLKFGAGCWPTQLSSPSLLQKIVRGAGPCRFSAPSQPQFRCGQLAPAAFKPKPALKNHVGGWPAQLSSPSLLKQIVRVPLFSTNPTSNSVPAAGPRSFQAQACFEKSRGAAFKPKPAKKIVRVRAAGPRRLSAPSQLQIWCGLLACAAFKPKPVSKIVRAAGPRRFSAPSQPQFRCGLLARAAFKPKPALKNRAGCWPAPLFSTKLLARAAFKPRETPRATKQPQHAKTHPRRPPHRARNKAEAGQHQLLVKKKEMSNGCSVAAVLLWFLLQCDAGITRHALHSEANSNMRGFLVTTCSASLMLPLPPRQPSPTWHSTCETPRQESTLRVPFSQMILCNASNVAHA